ncbi:MAG: hypothetical protein GY810_07085 [Aureispira sp.]|nr:hypothetical protein [Aureispira sp.]
MHFYLLKEGTQLSFGEVLDLWEHSVDFCMYYNELLSAVDFEAFYWETPPMTKATLDRPFEFVLVYGRALLSIKAEPHVFAEHFEEDKLIVDFPNLGGDAQLIVPYPIDENQNYTHLAKVLRNAPIVQKNELWRTCAKAYRARLNDQKPIWLSTAGLGVSWLHIRVDSRPKYYKYTEYKTFSVI